MNDLNQVLDAPENSIAPNSYAGFWMRFGALLIDGLVLIIPIYGLMFFFFYSRLEAGGAAPQEPPMMAMVGILFLTVILPWLYYAMMESGKNQGTLGKMALGIKVTNMDGGKISFLKATGRYFGKIISGIVLYIGYLMAGFTDKKQALHDIMASCLVVKK